MPTVTTVVSGSRGRASAPGTRTDVGEGHEELVEDLFDLLEDRAPASLLYHDRDRYKILAEQGRGGLGRVWRAHDRVLGRVVAVKELLRRTDDTEAQARFVREWTITARLEHPGIVPIHEAGRFLDGTPFYTMKLYAGGSLADALAKTETFAERLALFPRLIAVADAVAYAHERGTLHRDLKPSNVVIDDHGVTVVIDWGVGKELPAERHDESTDGPSHDLAASHLTVAGQVVGTVAYMSPEQHAAQPVGKTTDVYSLGAMLFELCAGDPPSADATIDDLRRELEGVPEDLAAIAIKALAKSPEDRYPDAGAFAADLKAYDTGARIGAREYSLAAMLGLWIRHHKAIARVVAAATVIVTLIGLWALLAVIARGEREAAAKREAEKAQVVADKERAVAENERDGAIRAQAAMLIEKDPTKARDLLASRATLTPDEALLMARAQGAGTADHILSFLPFKIWAAVPDEQLEKLAIVASDHRLRIIDLSIGKVEVVDDQLLEPPLLAHEGNGFIYGRRGRDGPELVRTGNSMNRISLLQFRMSTDKRMVASADGTYLLGANGELLLLSHKGSFRSVGHGFRGIRPYRDGLLACTKTALVRVAGGAVTHLGRCRHEGPHHVFATAKDSYVAQATPSTVVLYREGVHRYLQFREPNLFTMADSGLVVGIDDMQRSWYLPPATDKKVYGPSSDAKLRALGADGALAAWGDMDGVAYIRDTRSGTTWTFVGHSAPIAWVFVSERLGRVVTVGWPEVRVWRIPPFSVRPIAPVSSDVFTMASSHDARRVAFTCNDGTVGLVERNKVPAGVRILHRHSNLAFGVTWRGDEVCSSSRDGKVICTDVVKDTTTVIAEHPRPIRFVHSSGDVLAYTVEDGGVWAHTIGEKVPKLLYRHLGEPHRVAVNAAGDVASGANNGSVMMYHRSTGEVREAKTPHTDRVYHIHWRGQTIQTSSYDGTIRTWGSDLALQNITHTNHPVRELELLSSGWAANIGGARLWLQGKSIEMDLQTGPVIADLAVSPDSRFVGAIVGDDLVVYDTLDKALAAIRLSDRSKYLHFVDARNIFVFGSSNEISSISVEALPFAKIASKGVTP